MPDELRNTKDFSPAQWAEIWVLVGLEFAYLASRFLWTDAPVAVVVIFAVLQVAIVVHIATWVVPKIIANYGRRSR